MTTDDLEALFEKHDGEFLRFERIENPRHPRPDMCAFLLLHDLGTKDPERVWRMLGHAEHDQVWIDADADTFAANATEADVITLIRCGIRYEEDAFVMFV